MDILLGLMLTASVPAYFLIQPATLLAWRGGWRTAALAPLILVVPAFFFSLYAYAQESNLWPLTLIFAAALGTLYLAALWFLQRLPRWE